MMNEGTGQIQTSRTRSKKWFGLVVLLLIICIGGFIFVEIPPREPSYQGKSLSYWLTRYQEQRYTNPAATECKDAVRHVGTNAIPALLRVLRAKDSPLKTAVANLFERQNVIPVPFAAADQEKWKAEIGFELLDDMATNAIPALIEIHEHSISQYSQIIAGRALQQLYPAPAVTNLSWVPPKERAQWYLDAGMVKLQTGAASNAILAFSQAVVMQPTNAAAYAGRCNAKMQLRDFTGAVTDINRSIELAPSNYTAFLARGICNFNLKDFRNADADLTAAINLETNDADAYNIRSLARANLRDLDAALADCNTAIKVSEKFPSSASYRNRAIVKTLRQEYESALDDASRAVELGPREPTAYACRGRVQSALKDYRGALADFNRAIELNPKDPSAYSSRAAASILLNEFSNGSADLEKALELDPKNANAFLFRGVLEAKRGGRDEAALADFQHAVELAPQTPEARGLLGVFQYRVSQWEPSLTNCRKALTLGATRNVGDFCACIWLIRAQSSDEKGGNQELEAYLNSLSGPKTNDWSAITARFFIGGVTETNYLSMATSSARRPSAVRSQVCESLYYAGMKRKVADDKQGAAILFQKCVDTKDDNNFAYLNAVREMRVLNGGTDNAPH
jgi:tetratricopeptide (TPR) repeat protein